MISWCLNLLLVLPFVVSGQFSSDTVPVDKSVTLNLVAQSPEGFHLDVAALKAALASEGVTVDHIEAGAAELRDGEVVQPLAVTLEPWEAGQHLVPLFGLEFIDSQGNVVPSQGGLLTLDVTPIPTNLERQIRSPLVPLVDKPRLSLSSANQARTQEMTPHIDRGLDKRLARRKSLMRTLLLLGILGGIVTLASLYRRRRRPLDPLKIHLDPKKAALEALAALKAQDYPSRGLYEPFYRSLTVILRRYLEEGYGLRAPRRSTEEFLQEIANSRVLGGESETLRQVLGLADLVKFARQGSDTGECDTALTAVSSLIEQEHALA